VFDPDKLDLSRGCPSDAYPKADCPFFGAMSQATVRENTIETIDGELVPYQAPVTAEWCAGLDMRKASGHDYSRLLRAAGDDPVRLYEIAQARGYHPGWIDHRIEYVRQLRVKYGAPAP
jgi:hypothetical protein